MFLVHVGKDRPVTTDHCSQFLSSILVTLHIQNKNTQKLTKAVRMHFFGLISEEQSHISLAGEISNNLFALDIYSDNCLLCYKNAFHLAVTPWQN